MKLGSVGGLYSFIALNMVMGELHEQLAYLHRVLDLRLLRAKGYLFVEHLRGLRQPRRLWAHYRSLFSCSL